MNLVRKLVGAPDMPEITESDAPALSELDRAVDILVEMKDLSEAAVGLAYSSILFNNRALAAEVGVLEGRSDQLEDELESWVLRAAPEARNVDELAADPARLGLQDDPRRRARADLVRRAGRATAPRGADGAGGDRGDERETSSSVASPADGTSLPEFCVETETGTFVLAVQRGSRWDYPPRAVYAARG